MSNIQNLLAGLKVDDKELREASVYAARASFITVVSKLLEDQGWTQRQLAEAMDVSPGRISQILSEKTDVTFSNVAAILFCLGLDTSSMLHETYRNRQAESWTLCPRARPAKLAWVGSNVDWAVQAERRPGQTREAGLPWVSLCDDSNDLLVMSS